MIWLPYRLTEAVEVDDKLFMMNLKITNAWFYSNDVVLI